MKYEKMSYKYYELSSSKTGKANVLPDLLYDCTHCSPKWIHKTKTTLQLYFAGDKYQCLYILPVSCENLVNNLMNEKESK